jgi:predicted transcriptional regulator of viral defense system
VDKSKMTRLKQLFAQQGPIVRSKQLKQHGFDSRSIQSLLAADTLIRLKDGYYVMSDTLPQLSDAQIAAATISGAVLYFLSAAAFHQLTTVIPACVYVAVPNKGVLPVPPAYPPVDITRFIPRIHALGKTMAATTPVPVACYNRERTICDLAKRWQEVGKDVLIEAIRTYLQGDRNLQLLYDYADNLCVRDIIHPYLEAMA